MDAVQDPVEQQRQQLIEAIQKLPAETLQEVADQVARLRSETADCVEAEQTPEPAEESAYEKFKKSGLIGCMEGPPDLSVNYKKYLAEGWARKYDNR